MFRNLLHKESDEAQRQLIMQSGETEGETYRVLSIYLFDNAVLIFQRLMKKKKKELMKSKRRIKEEMMVLLR